MQLNPVRASSLFLGLCLAFAGGQAPASQERADGLTQSAPGMDAHPDRGGEQFARHCASCHGPAAQGDAARAIPSLAGQRFDYLVRQLANFASKERDNATMYHVVSDKSFSEPQTWNDVAAHLNRLPPLEQPQAGDGTKVALGRGIFREQCASCHHQDATGDKEGFVPSLRNQHYGYLAAQLHRLAEGHRHNVDQNLVLFMRSFDQNDVTAVADYLSRLRGPGSAHGRRLSNGVVVN